MKGLWHADFTCRECGKVIDHHAATDEGRNCGMSIALLMADAVSIHRSEDKCPCGDGWDHTEWVFVATEGSAP